MLLNIFLFFASYDENEILKLKETEVRPRARMILKWDEVKLIKVPLNILRLLF